jgi:hypothetical protein
MNLPDYRKITQFVAKLSRAEKKLFYSTVAVVALMGLDRVVIHPIQARMRALDESSAQAARVIKEDLAILSIRERIRQEAMSYAPMLNRIDFDERDVSALLKEIETYAVESKVNLQNLKPQGKKALKDWNTYQVTLSGEGDMYQIIQFMHTIERSNSMFVIDKYQIAPKKKDSSIASCSMTLYKVIM